MDSMTLFIASLAVSCIGALASVLLIKADNAAKTAGCLIGAVAAVLSFVAGIQAVLGDVTSVDTIVFFPFAHFQLLLNQLSGLFVALISVLAFAGSIYGLNYFDEYPGKKGRAGFFFNTFVASMMLVITADNVFWFLVAFELMSLTSYFLVVIEENENSIHGGWLYFVIAHVGFVLIMASFLTMTNFAGGSFAFADFRATQFSPAVASVCFVLAFFGFGAKAGIIPLHGWLPKAHPEAPSNVSALMSGGMIKIGISASSRLVSTCSPPRAFRSGGALWSWSSVRSRRFSAWPSPCRSMTSSACWPITPSRTSASFCSASAPPWPPWHSTLSASPSWL